MPRVRYTGGGGYYIRDGPGFDSEGDEAEINERTAERLIDRPDFEYVEDGSADQTDSAGSEFEVADAHTLADDIEARDELREEMIATVESGTVPEVADAVEAGQYDGYLDMLVELEEQFGGDRVGVRDAVEERREVAE